MNRKVFVFIAVLFGGSLTVDVQFMPVTHNEVKYDIRLPPSVRTSSSPGLDKGFYFIFGVRPKDTDIFVYDQEGKFRSLSCHSKGVPGPRNRWLRNNQPLELTLSDAQQPISGDITINVTSYNHGDFYQCIAENQYGIAVSDIYHVQRLFFDPPPYPPVVKYSGREGEGLVLPCGAPGAVWGYPHPNAYYWEIDREEPPYELYSQVPLDNRIQMDLDGNLYFTHLQQSDHKDALVYKCRAVFDGFRSEDVVFRARIDVTPSDVDFHPASLVYQTPTQIVGFQGESVYMKCIYTGLPAPTIHWIRSDGQPLPEGRHEYIRSGDATVNFGIQLTQLEFSDEGQYECKGINSPDRGESQHDDSGIIYLEVRAKPAFVEMNEIPGYALSDMNATDGDVVRFHCFAEGKPQVSIKWSINGEELNEGLERISLENNGSVLVVSDVCKDCFNSSRFTDLMVIQCNASNKHGYVFRQGYLNVLSATLISRGAPANLLQIHKEANLTCRAKSDDSTRVRYSWQWNGGPVELIPGKVEENADSSLRLIIDDGGGETHLTGEYTCLASNGYSNSSASTVIKSIIPIKDCSFGELSPLSGPLAGGTVVEWSVTEGCCPDSVLLGNYTLSVTSASINNTTASTLFSFITPPVLEAQQMSIIFGYMATNGMWLLDPRRNFTYSENPQIKELEPKKITIGGGTVMTAIGANLDSVADPKMNLTQKEIVSFTNNKTFSAVQYPLSSCRIKSTEQMECPTPPLDLPSVDEFGNFSVRFSIGFILDGFDAYSEITETKHNISLTITVTELAAVEPHEWEYDTVAKNPLIMEISWGAFQNQAIIKAGGFQGKILKVFNRQLIFQPPRKDKLPVERGFFCQQSGEYHSVTVSAGNTVRHAGCIKYTSPKLPLYVIIGASGGGVVLLGLVIGAFCCCKKKPSQHQPMSKSTPLAKKSQSMEDMDKEIAEYVEASKKRQHRRVEKPVVAFAQWDPSDAQSSI